MTVTLHEVLVLHKSLCESSHNFRVVIFYMFIKNKYNTKMLWLFLTLTHFGIGVFMRAAQYGALLILLKVLLSSNSCSETTDQTVKL